jgi:hypothetical protein
MSKTSKSAETAFLRPFSEELLSASYPVFGMLLPVQPLLKLTKTFAGTD